MRISYHIYNSAEFIGFCVLNKNGTTTTASLLLFSTLLADYHPGADQSNQVNKLYPISTPDLEIIQDLLKRIIPEPKSEHTFNIRIDGKSQVLEY